MKTCLIIPFYNHPQAIVDVVSQLKHFGLRCFLINDGSSKECSTLLKRIAEEQREWITLYERADNGGKGAAVCDGFRLAIQKGYTHAIQVDADGQHRLEDCRRFLQASAEHPEAMILGKPSFDASVPKKRLYGRQLTNLWIWINTLSFDIADGMCGFRCYPLTAVKQLIDSVQLGQRMDFDIDIVVRLYWQGVEAVNLETAVQYPLDGISHFKMGRDNMLISRKHTELFFGMVWRLPQLLARKFSVIGKTSNK